MANPFVLLAQTPPQPSPLGALVPMLLILKVFYFLLFAPMRKRQREHKKLLDALKKGDRVVTTGGLLGEVTGVEGAVVHLKVADQVRVRVTKSAVAGMQDSAGDEQ